MSKKILNVLPFEEKCINLATTRTQELLAIQAQVAQCQHGSRAFQKLPRHMQRKALSSNPKRLPKKIRDRNRWEIGDKKKLSKRPSRKYRRRPGNLANEYNRRQAGCSWLETQIWHAKRFHMTKLWDHVLPQQPTNKGYRASLRAANETCLIQDVSYESCLQLEGPLEDLLKGFTHLLNKEDQNRMSESQALEGRIWNEYFMYKYDRFPYQAIGNVQFYWHPELEERCKKKLWLWIHPSIFKEILATLVSIFDFELEFSKDEEMEEGTTSEITNNEANVAGRRVSRGRTPRYRSKQNYKIQLINLKGTLNRFSLIGPMTHSILSKVLLPIDVKSRKEGGQEDENANDCSIDTWWKEYFENDQFRSSNDYYSSYWQGLGSEPPKCKLVLGFIVRDIRLILPSQKRFCDTNNDSVVNIMEPFAGQLHHPILDSTVRDTVISTLPSTDTINKQRSEQLCPGLPMPVKDEESRIPVLLLFHPSSHVSGIGSRWDLILPHGVGNIAWVALHLNGAVAGGQEQQSILNKEFLLKPDSHLYPDTPAGKSFTTLQISKRMEEYFKQPPKCRDNFIKLGVQNPFGASWAKLMKTWCPETEDFHVVRDCKFLQHLASLTCKRKGSRAIEPPSKKIRISSESELTNLPNKISTVDKKPCNKLKLESSIELSKNMCHLAPNSLIYIRLISIGKGTIDPAAMICLPTNEDLKTISVDGQPLPDKLKSSQIREAIHKDSNWKQREELKLVHKRIKKLLQRGRQRVTKSSQTVNQTSVNAEGDTSQINHDAEEKMKQFVPTMNSLWLINDESSLQICSRLIIGYITDGGFSQVSGRCSGLGWIATKPLLNLMAKVNVIQNRNNFPDFVIDKKLFEFKQVFVLVRNPNSLTYSWARLVILDL